MCFVTIVIAPQNCVNMIAQGTISRCTRRGGATRARKTDVAFEALLAAVRAWFGVIGPCRTPVLLWPYLRGTGPNHSTRDQRLGA